ncbi:hypothetical protein [Agromyces bauzanensis]
MRSAARTRVLTLARALLPLSDGVSNDLVAELCSQAGISVPAFRRLFPTNADLLRGMNQQLIDECATRLSAATDRFRPPTGDDDLKAAAVALAEAWPMDWAALTIRSRERADALAGRIPHPEVVEAERSFVPALLDAFLTLMVRLNRQFVWPPVLAVRVVILAYERSFEAWIMAGGNERTFASSPFVTHTLPQILAGLSRPIEPASPRRHPAIADPRG